MVRRLGAEAPVGTVSLMMVNEVARNAVIGINIGQSDAREQGYGTDAMRIIVRYGFLELNLHRLSLEVYSYNPRAMAVYRKLGFVEEGRRRAHVWRDGQPHDSIVMGLLREEWHGTRD